MTKSNPTHRHPAARGRMVTMGSRILIALCLAGIGLAASAATYYRWVDDEGITHYTSTPPSGVAAEKVTSASSRSPTAPAETDKTDANGAANQGEPQQTAQPASLKDPERCAQARKRMETLNTGGRIRMATDDGSFRYLSPEDIQEEISASQQAIDESC